MPTTRDDESGCFPNDWTRRRFLAESVRRTGAVGAGLACPVGLTIDTLNRETHHRLS